MSFLHPFNGQHKILSAVIPSLSTNEPTDAHETDHEEEPMRMAGIAHRVMLLILLP